MSNHCEVRTRKHLSEDKVSAVLNRLNDSILKGKLELEVSHSNNLPFWNLSYRSEGKRWAFLSFWLKSKNCFEIRNSTNGYGNFCWWINSLIINEIAVEFNGIIYDEGLGGESVKPVPGKYNDLYDFLENIMWGHVNEDIKAYFLQEERIPPELKKKKKDGEDDIEFVIKFRNKK